MEGNEKPAPLPICDFCGFVTRKRAIATKPDPHTQHLWRLCADCLTKEENYETAVKAGFIQSSAAASARWKEVAEQEGRKRHTDYGND